PGRRELAEMLAVVRRPVRLLRVGIEIGQRQDTHWPARSVFSLAFGRSTRQSGLAHKLLAIVCQARAIVPQQVSIMALVVLRHGRNSEARAHLALTGVAQPPCPSRIVR